MSENDLEMSSTTGALAFDRMPLPAIVMTASGEVAGANAAALGLIEGGLLALGGDGRLSLGQARETQRLELALKKAGAGLANQRLAARIRDGRARSLEVCPLADEHVLVSVRTLAADRGPRLEALADIYGLTPGELRILSGLVEGASPKAVAETLDVSLNTVRTHIRSLLWKCAEPNLSSLLCYAIQIC